MKRMFYSKLASNGISKNQRTYIPYILTCTGMVMMFYIISFLAQNEAVASMRGGRTMQTMLSLGCGVVGVFSLIFLFYTNSFLIRRRKKEFGLYNILGMGKWNLARILVWETLIVSAVSLVSGLFCGILFSKIAELCMVNMLGGKTSFTFSVGGMAALQTVLLFVIIFALILLNTLRQIHLSNPIQLLSGENVGEKPPKANWILAVLGMILLVAAYYLAVSIQEPLMALSWFFVAVIMVIIATYLLFISGSVVFCKVLQKNKKYYYKSNHFVSLSSMVYRMKRNGAGLASICILSTMVLVMLSSTVCLYLGTETTLRNRYPKDFVLQTYSMNPEYTDKVENKIQQVLQKNNEQAKDWVEYRYLNVGGYLEKDHIILDQEKVESYYGTNYSQIRQLFILPLEDYNQMMKTSETLEKNEVLIYSTKADYNQDTVTIDGLDTMKVKKKLTEFLNNGLDLMQMIPSFYIIVPDLSVLDAIYDRQAEVYGDNKSNRMTYYAFNLACDEEKQQAIHQDMLQGISDLYSTDENYPSIRCESIAEERGDFYALYGGLFFLGILLGLVFISAAVLMMYYKQISEGYEDQSRFEIMQKVGMTKKEIQKSINSQVLTVFFLPLLIAGVHVTFAFPLISKLLLLFNLTDTGLLILITIGCYLIFALFYIIVYRFTSRAYYHIVSN